MNQAPAVGATVYFISNNMTVMSGVVVEVCVPHQSWRGVLQGIYIKQKGRKRLRYEYISELDENPVGSALKVQANINKKITTCEKRLARLKNALAKVEAHLASGRVI